MEPGSKRVSQVLYPRKPYASEPAQDNKEISLTQNSQPATLSCSIGCFDFFKAAGFKPNAVAGHSLGEFSALYAAESVDRKPLYELVCARAKAMRDTPKNGGMAAVIGSNADSIRPTNANVWLANCNSPLQTVITGAQDAVNLESQRLCTEGFKVVPLACDGAFHSPLMYSAATTLNTVLDATEVRKTKVKFFLQQRVWKPDR